MNVTGGKTSRHPPIGMHNSTLCVDLVDEFLKCKKEHPFKLNACQELREVMDACLYKEFEIRSKENREKSQKRMKRFHEIQALYDTVMNKKNEVDEN